MSRILSISLKFEEPLELYLKSHYPEIKTYKILSKSLDARGAPKGRHPRFNYKLDLEFEANANDNECRFKKIEKKYTPPIIVGMGPSGLFCALRLLFFGVKSIVLDRGAQIDERKMDIATFWKTGSLNENSNVCFGEGGAGMYSDGKLFTRVKSPYLEWVFEKLISFGASEEILYLNAPHLGSDGIRKILFNLTKYLKEKGCAFHYKTNVTELFLEKKQDSTQKIIGVKTFDGRSFYSDSIILATGHSARNIYEELYIKNVKLGPKDFAVGVRIEHPKSFIDRTQYGHFSKNPLLGPARYALSFNQKPKIENKEKDAQTFLRGFYSFCMCPGGYVINSSTENSTHVINGMSNQNMASPWSNSALVVTVKRGIDFPSGHVLEGLKFQKRIEENAYKLSRKIPVMRLSEFLNGKIGDGTVSKLSMISKVEHTDFTSLFPSSILETMRLGLEDFNRKIKGFIHKDATLYAPETRTSAPLKILRDKYESVNTTGLYPCGEGAGYAGGISSAALDGIRVAESVILKMKGENV